MKQKTFSQIMQIVCLLALVLSMSSCASRPDSLLAVKAMQVGGVEVVSRNAEVELVIFKTPDDKERFCLSPPPDSVSTFGEGVGLAGGENVGNAGVSEGISFGSGEGALSLGGRGEAILITRELMYRACEVAMNINADSDLTLQVYRETLQAIAVIAKGVNDAGSPPLSALAPSESMKVAVSGRGGDDGNNGDDGGDDDDDDDGK